MSRACHILILLLGVMAAPNVASAQAGPLPCSTKPAADGATFDQTLEFLDKVFYTQATVTWESTFRSDTGPRVTHYTQQLTGFSYNDGTISYHMVWTSNGVVYGDDFDFSLADVKAIVASGSQETRGGSGVFAVSNSVNPPTVELSLQGPEKSPRAFVFTDFKAAGQIARALAHAASLCGSAAEVRTQNLSAESLALFQPKQTVAAVDSAQLAQWMDTIRTTMQSVGWQGVQYYGMRGENYYEIEFNSVAVPAPCKLTYSRTVRDDAGPADSSLIEISLHSVHDISVSHEPKFSAAFAKQLRSKLGRHPLVYSPAMVEFTYDSTNGSAEDVPFPTAAAAKRFSDVLEDAAKACGGGNIEF